MSKYTEDEQYLNYFKKTREPNLSKVDYALIKLEKIEKLLKEIKKELIKA